MTTATVWRRYFDTDLAVEPAPASLVVANGVHLPAGRYELSIEPVGGAPSAYRVNAAAEQKAVWNSRLYVFLPDREQNDRFVRTAFGPGAQDTPAAAQAAFNALPAEHRTFELYGPTLLVMHPGFDYRDNEGRMCVVVTRAA